MRTLCRCNASLYYPVQVPGGGVFPPACSRPNKMAGNPDHGLFKEEVSVGGSLKGKFVSLVNGHDSVGVLLSNFRDEQCVHS